MPARTGRCTNFGNCATADGKKVVEIATGNELICPECGHQLSEIPRESAPSSAVPILVVLLLLLIGGGSWFLLRKKGPDKGSSVVPMTSSSAPSGGNVVLRLHGSNTIGAKLAPDLAAAFLKQQGASDVKIVPGAADEVTVQGVLPGESAPQAIEIEAHGSATAFSDLAAVKCDIGMASRPIKRDEVTSLASLGDMTSPAAEHVLGLDGVAVIVNRANSIQSLTKDQLAQIFSGDVTSWKQVLSSSGGIRLYRRDDKSGTADTFKTLVLGGRSFAASAVTFEDSRILADKVANDPDGIGFVSLSSVGGAKPIAVSETGATPLLPTRLTVATEDYPLSRRLFLYTPANPRNPLVRKFVDFALGKAGQDVVADDGFVSQNVTAINTKAAVGGSSEYQKLTAGAERLSLNFRFRIGSSELDNKAIVDLDRVVTFIGDLRYTGDDVFLFGFADSTGGRDLNVRLSKDRAKTVSDQFGQRGLKPAVVTGFGSDLPVASNTTEDGREKNRRVEIWIRKK
jgi:phosphate transport system substrate-binding protein